MNKTTKLIIAGSVAFAAGIAAGNAFANDRYQPKGHIIVSPDLTAPWVTQLQQVPAGPLRKKRPVLSRAYEASSAYVKPLPRKIYTAQPVENVVVSTRQLRNVGSGRLDNLDKPHACNREHFGTMIATR